MSLLKQQLDTSFKANFFYWLSIIAGWLFLLFSVVYLSWFLPDKNSIISILSPSFLFDLFFIMIRSSQTKIICVMWKWPNCSTILPEGLSWLILLWSNISDKKIAGKNSISIYQLQVFERSLDCAVMPNLFRHSTRTVDEKVPVKEASSNPAKTKNPAELEQD